jgi:hypothetical protein
MEHVMTGARSHKHPRPTDRSPDLRQTSSPKNDLIAWRNCEIVDAGAAGRGLEQ